MALDFASGIFAESDEQDGALAAGLGIVYLSLVKDFTDIKDVFATPTTPEEQVTIDGDHTWAAGKGVVPFEWDKTTEESKLSAMMNGEGRGANTKIELLLKYPGKSRNVEALLKSRPALIAFAGDLNCASGKFVQVGTRCFPAFISNFEFVGGNTKAGENKGYLITIEAYGQSIVNYDGAITLAS